MKPNWRYPHHAEQFCDAEDCDSPAQFLVLTADGARMVCWKHMTEMFVGKV